MTPFASRSLPRTQAAAPASRRDSLQRAAPAPGVSLRRPASRWADWDGAVPESLLESGGWRGWTSREGRPGRLDTGQSRDPVAGARGPGGHLSAPPAGTATRSARGIPLPPTLAGSRGPAPLRWEPGRDVSFRRFKTTGSCPLCRRPLEVPCPRVSLPTSSIAGDPGSRAALSALDTAGGDPGQRQPERLLGETAPLRASCSLWVPFGPRRKLQLWP